MSWIQKLLVSVGLLALSAGVIAAVSDPAGFGHVPNTTVATLPGGAATGTMRYVTDGDSTIDCVNGEGSNMVLCIYDGTVWSVVSGSASTPTLDQAFDAGKVINGANSLANAFRVGDGVSPATDICIFTDATLGGYVTTCGAANVRQRIQTNQTGGFYDVEGASDILTIDPDAASVNAMYQFTSGYKLILSMMLPLEPRGAATSASESIVSNQPKAWYLTVTDANTDAADFSFNVTSKMVGATTATFRLVGVSKNASPSGNIDLDCAMSKYTPGTNTFAAHVTTGEVTALLTPATQNRPVAVTTSAHTINGTLTAGDIVFGSCEVDATATTSAQMTDFRLYGFVLVQLSVNSWSD